MARVKYFDEDTNSWQYADSPAFTVEADVVNIDRLQELGGLGDNDEFIIRYPEVSRNYKVKWGTIKTLLRAIFNGFYAALSHTHVISDITNFPTVPTVERVQNIENAVEELDDRVTDVETEVESKVDSTTVNSRIYQHDSSPLAHMDIRELITSGGSGTGRNILDNGGFIINQRGESEYVGQGYGFDRWIGLQDSSSVSKPAGQGYVSLSADDVNTPIIEQRIEQREALNLKNRKLTLSAYVKSRCTIRLLEKTSSSYATTSRIIATLACSTVNAVNKITFETHDVGQYLSVAIYPYGSGSEVQIVDVMLEVGEASSAETFVPDYTQELLRCQRYCYVIKPSTASNVPLASCGYATGQYALFSLKLPTEMVSIPTLVCDNNDIQFFKTGLINSSGRVLCSNLVILNMTKDFVTIRGNTNNDIGLTSVETGYVPILSGSADSVIVTCEL